MTKCEIEIRIGEPNSDWYDHEGYYDTIEEAIAALLEIKVQIEKGERY